MYHVRFDRTAGRYGTFTTVAQAQWWAKHGCDGSIYAIHQDAPSASD